MYRTSIVMRIVLSAAVCFSLLIDYSFAGIALQPDSAGIKQVNELLSKIAIYDYGQSREPLNALTKLIGKTLDSAQSLKEIEKALITFLGSKSTPGARQFVCEQLSLIGTKESVPELAVLLADPNTSDMARYALERIPGYDAETALRKVLLSGQVDNKVMIGIINSLGNRRDGIAIFTLHRMMSDPDQDLADACVRALGQIGKPGAAYVLLDAVDKTIGKLRDQVLNAGLKAADQMLAEGLKFDALAVYKKLSMADSPAQIQAAALKGMAAAGGWKKDEQDLLEREKAEGFVPLFNGKDLSGWGSTLPGYFAEDGKIICPRSTTEIKYYQGNLYTEKEYASFILRFEFMLSPGELGNNGVGIRTTEKGSANEIAILDDLAEGYNPPKRTLEPYQYHGSMYGVYPARVGYLRPVGHWNTEEITANDRRLMVKLNGATILDVDIDKAIAESGKNYSSWKRERGRISLLGHGSRVEFSNIRIKEIK